ncbi:MAG: hypothetical protein EOP33_01060 [Rickettsiaceae bacterium]|nr:MAG: hypothetical protein EOP33_01060 [Rickettsiaceae bacterium]
MTNSIETNIEDLSPGNQTKTQISETNAPIVSEIRTIKRDGVYDLCSSRREKVLPFLGNNSQKFERLARSFAFEINTNPKLASCDQLSILQAFYKCCEYGLDPASSLQQIWMIPYNGKIDFQIGYKGWLQLLWGSKLITNAYSCAVYQGDQFEYELGLNPNIKHIPQHKSINDVNELIATYGVIKLKSNEVQLRVCWRDELEKSKKSSKSNGREDSPWNRHFEAMALIVPMRKMAKNLALALRAEDFDDEDYVNENNNQGMA